MENEDQVYTRLCVFLSEAPFFNMGRGWGAGQGRAGVRDRDGQGGGGRTRGRKDGK